jgi:hypothetical protein
MATSANSPLQDLLPMELPLTRSAEGSRAKTSQPLAKALALRVSAAAFGANTPVSLANYDPASCSWRTSQRCLVEGWTVFSETWPRSGMMRSGIAYPLQPLAPLTDETGSGLWPTPQAHDKAKGYAHRVNRHGTKHGGRDLTDWVQMWPTPSATMSKGSSPAALTRKTGASRENDRLDHAVMATDGGQLNPTWVEWLMGFPLGHTDLELSETP